jgi:PhnB protein
MNIQPYLFFNGHSEAAIEHYKKALGAEVVRLSRFGDNPGPPMGPKVTKEKIMHADIRVGDTHILISDGQCGGATSFDGFSLAVTANSEADADKKFAALADGGKITMPLAQTFFAKRYGQVSDRFGVHWMVLFGSQG